MSASSRRIQIYWKRDDAWYMGTVNEDRSKGHFLFIEYDDGAVEFIDARYTTYKRNGTLHRPKTLPKYTLPRVGSTVNVWWPNEKRHFRGKVRQTNKEHATMLVFYEDGEIRWTDFQPTHVRVMDELNNSNNNLLPVTNRPLLDSTTSTDVDCHETNPSSPPTSRQHESTLVLPKKRPRETVSFRTENKTAKKSSLPPVGSRVCVGLARVMGTVTAATSFLRVRYDKSGIESWIHYDPNIVTIMEERPDNKVEFVGSTSRRIELVGSEPPLLPERPPPRKKMEKKKRIENSKSNKKPRRRRLLNSNIGEETDPRKKSAQRLQHPTVGSRVEFGWDSEQHCFATVTSTNRNQISVRCDNGDNLSVPTDAGLFRVVPSVIQHDRFEDHTEDETSRVVVEKKTAVQAKKNSHCKRPLTASKKTSTQHSAMGASSKPSALPPAGSRVRVLWTYEDTYYEGFISKRKGSKAFVHYDDGDKDWADFDSTKGRFIYSNGWKV